MQSPMRKVEGGESEATDGNTFPLHPLPLLTHSLPTLPNFLAHPRRAPSFARFSFACSISARPEKGKESAAMQAKRCLISMPFQSTYIDAKTVNFFPTC